MRSREQQLRFIKIITKDYNIMSLELRLVNCPCWGELETDENLEARLNLTSPGLLDKPRLVAVTKCDLVDELDRKRIRRSLPPRLPIMFISAVSEDGLQRLKDQIWNTLNPKDKL